MYAVRIVDLPGDALDAWAALHAGGRAQSPFLHPEFARAVGAVRSDVEVGVVTLGDEPVGFLPFQRGRFGVGGPVGGRLCDESGAVVRPDVQWRPSDVARAADLRALRLSRVALESSPFRPFLGAAVQSPYLDLEGGYAAYRDRALGSGSGFVKKVERRARQVERDVGPLRLEWRTSDPRVLGALLEWKAMQRAATRTPNVLALPWAAELVHVLRDTHGDAFGGVLSALWAGDTLAAAHLGLRTRDVFHYWVPAYNPDLAKYSPGLIALLALARAAAQEGIVRFDLGPGDERYKQRAADGERALATATVSAGGTVGSVVGAVTDLRAWARDTGLDGVVRLAGRSLLRARYALSTVLSTHRCVRDGRGSV